MDENPQDRKRMLRGFAILVAVYLVVVYLVPKPAAVKPEGWRLTGIFAATIIGSIIEPIPAGALVLLAVTLSALMGGLTITEALSGYSNSSVWLVLVAFFISRALIQTGLARRIALFFVRAFGHSSLGVAYSLAASDMVLAGMIPSNGARSAGVVLPIVRSISELYGSFPGETANRLGAYLMSAVYQAVGRRETPANPASPLWYTTHCRDPCEYAMKAGPPGSPQASPRHMSHFP